MSQDEPIYARRAPSGWQIGRYRRGQLVWRRWPYQRLLCRCACCGDLNEFYPEQVPMHRAILLDPGMTLVADTGQAAYPGNADWPAS